jgi:hypothetical protein
LSKSSTLLLQFFVKFEHNSASLVIREEGNEPEEGVVAENCTEVLAESSIIRLASVERVIVFTALLAELNSGILVADEVNMEGEEC